MESLIAENLCRIKDRIAAACSRANRAVNTVTLVAVTKSVGLDEIGALRALGITHFGENRIPNAEPKIAAMRENIVWHMIGTIQRRKAKDVCRLFDTVDTVDRLDLADELAVRTPVDRVPLPVLLEVNVSAEESKHGFAPRDVGAAVEHIRGLPGLRLDGLMTMAPLYDAPERTRPVFAALRNLAGQHGLARISMGMSNDFEIAIEEGSTEVRIGTALFEGL